VRFDNKLNHRDTEAQRKQMQIENFKWQIWKGSSRRLLPSAFCILKSAIQLFLSASPRFKQMAQHWQTALASATLPLMGRRSQLSHKCRLAQISVPFNHPISVTVFSFQIQKSLKSSNRFRPQQ
jgi:hypothetical protein